MFLTLIRKEIVGHVLSLRFAAAFILTILVVFASIYVTANQYLQDREMYFATAKAATLHQEEIAKEKDGTDQVDRLYWYGRMDALNVAPLSALVQGLRPHTPAAVITKVDDSDSVRRQQAQNPLAGLLQMPDLQYVVSVMLSLLAILFTFDAISGEKESGTLRLILSNSVPRAQILVAKWIGGYVVLIVPFLISSGGALLYAYHCGALSLEGDILSRIFWLLATACLYLSVFFTLGLLVSTLTHRSATSLFLSLLVWVVWILVIPNLSPVLAKILIPAPSREKIAAEKRAIDQETWMRIRGLTLTSGKLSYGDEMRKAQENLRAEGEAQKDKLDRHFRDTNRRQTDLAQTIGRLSPSGCWTYASTTMTDTGPENYGCFEDAQATLQKQLRKRAEDYWRAGSKDGKWPNIDVQQLPALTVRGSGFNADLETAMTDLLVLAIFNVVFFMGSFAMFLRYDVR